MNEFFPSILLSALLIGCGPRGTDSAYTNSDDDTGGQPVEVTPVPGTPTALDLGSVNPELVSVVPAGSSWAVTFINQINQWEYAVSWQGAEPIALPLTVLEEQQGTNLSPESYAATGLSDGSVAWVIVTGDNFDDFLGAAITRPTGQLDVATLASNASEGVWADSIGSEAVLIHHTTDGGSDLALRSGNSAANLSSGANLLELATPGEPAIAGDVLIVVGAEVSEDDCTGGALPVTLATPDGTGPATNCLDLGEDVVWPLTAAGGDGVAAALVLVPRGEDQVQLLVTFDLDGPSLSGTPHEVSWRGPDDEPLPWPSARAMARANQGWGLVSTNVDGSVVFTWLPDGDSPESFELGFFSDEQPSLAHTDDGFIAVGLSDDEVIVVEIALTAAS